MLLLDTCALLWLASDQKKLSLTAKNEIIKNAQELFVSAISAFEIAVKSRSGKLRLPLLPLDWFSEALDFHGIREIPVTSSIAVFSVQLPLLHNDPCDRIIIATAQLKSMKIVTSDKLISDYNQASVIW
ncbi:MAG: type II toxin-antitoxin system VapC family toxin [Candidatus Riflebacteria bacterium]|nr:type II toxin-antitoxin system VapC family toxin [Candidatus Riflebacteria bacterium]